MAQIKGKQIADNSIELSKIAKSVSGDILIAQGASDSAYVQVSGDATLANSGILTIETGAVDSNKLADNAVINSKIADGAVDTAELADNSVSTAKIQALAITTGKLEDLAVTELKLASDSVTTEKILNANVTFAKLASDVWSDSIELLDDDKLAKSSAIKAYVSSAVSGGIGAADTDDLAEGASNLYFTAARAKSAAVVDSTANDETDQAPSVHSIKAYVNLKFEEAVQGLDIKHSARVASVADVTIATPGASIDGVSLNNGDRVLLKNQTDATENGIYVWNGAASAMTRSADADNTPGAEVTTGMFIFVESGTVNAATSWILHTTGTIDLGTTALDFEQFGASTSYAAGEGISISGNTLSFTTSAITSSLAAGTDLAKEDSLPLYDASTTTQKKTTITALAAFLADGTTITATDGKLTSVAIGGVLTREVKSNPSAVAANATGSTGFSIALTPSNDSAIEVYLNGLLLNLGSSTNAEVYFSRNAGTTAVALADIVADDTLYFVGTANGFALETSDIIQVVYQA